MKSNNFITPEDYFHAFFAGIISFFIGFIIVFLLFPKYFQDNPSIPAIAFIVILEISSFFAIFFFMRRRH